MKYAVFFFLLGAGFLSLAVSGGGVLLFLCWPALSFAVVGTGYAGAGASIFGKSPETGKLSVGTMVILLPYLLLTWATWHLLRVASREAPFHKVDGGIYVGRRLLPHEYPGDVVSVVDLTSEFNERLPSRATIQYRLFACLDAAPVPVDRLRAIALEVAELPRPVYIHCAQGHGRTAMIVAALLTITHIHSSAAAALSAVSTARSGAVPSRAQKAAVLALAAVTPWPKDDSHP